LTRPVQEDDLHVYVDDRLDTARRAEVASHLQANPALQRRVEDWCQQAEGVLVLKRSKAQQGETVRMAFAGHQFRRVLADALGKLALHEGGEVSGGLGLCQRRR
jgi:anti-sigma factor RsiW